MHAQTSSAKLKTFMTQNAVWLLPILAMVLVLLVQWPQLHLPYIFHQDDTMPQLRRLESYVTSVRHGQYFPKVFPEAVRNFGYAFDAYYPSLMLLPYVWLRLMGMGVVGAYDGYQALILIATVLAAYASFLKIRRKPLAAFVFSMVYTTAVYRALDAFVRGALGENLAFIFLPIIAAGMYELYVKRTDNWFLLAFGVTGLMYAHMLSLVMVLEFLVGGFLVLVGMRRVTWRMVKYTILAALSTLLMGLGSYLPMIEMSSHIALKLSESATIWPNFILYSLGDLFENSLSMYASTSNMQNVGQAFRPGMGIFMLMTAIVLVIRWRKLNQAVKVVAGLGLLTIFLSTNLFPWSLFSKTIFGVIQFPWRYLELTTLFLSLAIGLIVADRPASSHVAWGLVLATCIVGFSYAVNINATMLNANIYRITDENATAYYEDATGGGSEYAPEDFDSTTFFKKTTYSVTASHQLTRLTMPTQTYNDMRFTYTSSKPVTLKLPKFGYVGYHVTISGKTVDYWPSGKNAQITITAQAGTHRVRVVYTGTTLQHVTGWLSLVAAFGFGGWWLLRETRRQRATDERITAGSE